MDSSKKHFVSAIIIELERKKNAYRYFTAQTSPRHKRYSLSLQEFLKVKQRMRKVNFPKSH